MPALCGASRHIVYAMAFCLFFSCLILTYGGGCSRPHYRVKADKEAYNLLACATQHPQLQLDDYRIDIDPRSRMFDRYDPDCEPMPPDDPLSHNKMHCVAGMKGSKHWHECGCTQCVENPTWKQYLLFNEQGAVSMDKDGAFELALLHSPEYQSALENLYLSALKVSQERFRFDVQFYGGDSLFYTAAGSLRSNRGTELKNNAEIEATKLFATGGELAVGLANSVTWTFAGPDNWRSESLFNINLVQPLLRNAGRKVVLERLTQSERDFLAAIRQMVFFQQGFYTKIVTGKGSITAPSGDSKSATPTYSGGFYGLLADQIQIQNQRQNIISLEENLERFVEIFAAGMMDLYQVQETRQNLLTSESALLQRVNSYATSIDTYLRSLGLPPDLPVEISDPLMERFQLTSSSLITLQQDLADLLSVIRQKDEPLPEDFNERLAGIVKRTESEILSLRNDVEVLNKSVPDRLESLRVLETYLIERIRAGERIDQSVYDSEMFQDRIRTLQDVDIPKNIRRLQSAFHLIDHLVSHDEPVFREKLREERFEDDVLDAMILLRLVEVPTLDMERELLKTIHDHEASGPVLDATRNEVRARSREIRERLERILQKQGNAPAPTPIPGTKTDKETATQRVIRELQEKDVYRDWIRRVLSAFQYELVSLSIMQTRARLDSITLVPTSITPEDAFEIASNNRLDWMNRRASLVDTWRQIDITANKLKSDLNVSVEGELGTIDKKGVRFDGDNGRLQVGVEWDSPLTRHNEMLDYRRAQVQYQSARREYYTYVDSVNADLRSVLRDIQINQVEFEIKRNAILIATSRVDEKQLGMEKPPTRGATIDANTAKDVISALDNLMTSQNQFLNTWVSYQTQRMLLDLYMGTMELDSKGRWVDPGTITKDRASSVSRSEGPYAGAFATPSKLVPSKKKSHRFGKLHARSKAMTKQVPAAEEAYGESDHTIPDAPRLAPGTILPEDPVFDGPMELPEPLKPTPALPLPVREEQPEKEVEKEKPVGPTPIGVKTARKVVPRSPMSPDTIPAPQPRPLRTLKSDDAPPPPRTPE